MRTTTPQPEPVTAAEQRRRQVVVAGVVVASAALVAVTFRVPRAGPAFYAVGAANVLVLTAGAVVTGPVRWARRGRAARDVVAGACVGGAAFVGFVVAAEVARRWDALAGPLASVLGKADAGTLGFVLALALVSGVAEELVFRGALWDLVPPRAAPVASVVAYVAATAPSGNAALALAAAVMGVVFAGVRARTGGIVAPAATHVVWSTLMITALPR